MINITNNGEPLNLYYTPGQNDIFNKTEEQFVCVPKGRRFGITQGAAIFCCKNLIKQNSILWVDTIQGNLQIYIDLYFMPILNKINRKFWQYKGHMHDLRFLKDHLYMRSAEKPQNIEGLGAGIKIIIINEAGIVLKGPKGRSLWYNTIFPMVLDNNARVFFLGTPKGKKSKKGEDSEFCLYYELALKGGLNGSPKEEKWKTLTYSSYDNPLIPPENIKQLESDVPAVVRRQEIGGEFIDVSQEQIFHPSWWRYTTKLPDPVNIKRTILSIDTAFKTGQENDYSAFVVMVEHRYGWTWVYTFNKRLEFPDLIATTISIYNDYKPDLVLVEDKGSGTSLVQTLKVSVPFAVVGVNPDKDKITRAVAVTPLIEQGRLEILRGKWNKESTDQLEDFTAALDTPDDIVDAFSQCLNYTKGRTIHQKAAIIKNAVSKRLKSTEIMRGF